MLSASLNKHFFVSSISPFSTICLSLPLCPSPSLSLPLSPSHPLSLCIPLPLSLPPSFSLSLPSSFSPSHLLSLVPSLFLYPFLSSLSLCLPSFLSLSLSLSFSLSLFLTLSLSLSHSLSLSLSFSLSLPPPSLSHLPNSRYNPHPTPTQCYLSIQWSVLTMPLSTQIGFLDVPPDAEGPSDAKYSLDRAPDFTALFTVSQSRSKRAEPSVVQDAPAREKTVRVTAESRVAYRSRVMCSLSQPSHV